MVKMSLPDDVLEVFGDEPDVTWWPCGSRVTCDPPPKDTDADFLVMVTDIFCDDMATRLVTQLLNLGFDRESGVHYDGDTVDGKGFTSWRRGELNLIVTFDAEFAKRHRAATHVCKGLNLMDKPARIALFQAVLYGEQRKF